MISLSCEYTLLASCASLSHTRRNARQERKVPADMEIDVTAAAGSSSGRGFTRCDTYVGFLTERSRRFRLPIAATGRHAGCQGSGVFVG